VSEAGKAPDLDEMIGLLRAVAVEAGQIIMPFFNANQHPSAEVHLKKDQSPVTEADEEAERLILKELRAAYPDIPVVAEEEAAAGRLPEEIGTRFFLVDPLDGTKEFISGNGEFTVNIALIEDRVPVAGVVFAPAKKRLFFGYGRDTLKACEQDADVSFNPPQLSAVRSIAVREAPSEGLTAVASRSHRDAQTDEYLNHYKIADLKSAGSSLKFCLVAAGEADLYPRHGRTMEWDTAAGHAVLRAAGGSVTRLDGTPFSYGKVGEGFGNDFFVAKGKGV